MQKKEKKTLLPLKVLDLLRNMTPMAHAVDGESEKERNDHGTAQPEKSVIVIN